MCFSLHVCNVPLYVNIHKINRKKVLLSFFGPRLQINIFALLVLCIAMIDTINWIYRLATNDLHTWFYVYKEILFVTTITPSLQFRIVLCLALCPYRKLENIVVVEKLWSSYNIKSKCHLNPKVHIKAVNIFAKMWSVSLEGACHYSLYYVQNYAPEAPGKFFFLRSTLISGNVLRVIVKCDGMSVKTVIRVHLVVFLSSYFIDNKNCVF